MIQQYRLYYYSLWSVIALLFPIYLQAQTLAPIDITVTSNADGVGIFNAGTIQSGVQVSTATTLRAAIDAANKNCCAPKITIHFSQIFTIQQTNGTYELTRSNVVIDGRDPNNAPGTTIVSSGKDPNIFKLSGVPQNCVLKNFKIQKPNACTANDATNPCTAILDYGDYTVIENNIFTNLANSNGIITHGQHATIRNNQLSGSTASPNTTAAISINNAGQGTSGKYVVYNNTISNFNVGIVIQDNQSNYIYRNNITCVKTAISLINTVFLDPNPTINTATTDEISGNAFNNDGAYPDSVQVFLYKNQNCAAGYTICPSGLYLGTAKVTGTGNTYTWKLPKTSFAQSVVTNDQVSAYSMSKTNAGSMSDYKNVKCVTVTGASSACIFSQTKEIIVINANDEGVGSLREAINCTNTYTGEGSPIIRFKLAANAVIDVGATSNKVLPEIAKTVLIYGDENVTLTRSPNIFSTGTSSGLYIRTFNVGVYGLKIKGFTYGIQVNDNGNALNNIIIGSASTKGHKNTLTENTYGIANFKTSNVLISGNFIGCNRMDGISSSVVAAPVVTSFDRKNIKGTAVAGATIEIFYANDPKYCAATTGASCQGQVYIATVVADNSGQWSYTATTDLNIALDVTATASLTLGPTKAALPPNATSAFSACKKAAAETCCIFNDADEIYVTTNADEGCGSLREAINCTNTMSGGIIRFKLPTGSTSIEVGKTSKVPLPPIKTPVTIYGNEIVGIYKSPNLIRDPKQLESGFFIISPNVKVYGMTILDFYYGIQVSDGNKPMDGIIIGDAKQVGHRNTIESNTIGIANYVISNVRISGNTIACNKNFGIESSVVKTPIITFFDKYAVKGTSEPNAEIEVFYNNYCEVFLAPCQGKTYMGTTKADAKGDWVLKSRMEIDELFNTNAEVTATATIQIGPVVKTDPPPPPNTTSDFANCKKHVPCTGIIVTKPPRDTVFNCAKASVAEYQNWIKINGGAIVSSDCGTIKYGFFSTTPYPKIYGCRSVVPVTFVFDDGTNKKEIQANFIIEDKTPPVLSKPCDLTVSCSKTGRDSIYTWLSGNCISYTDCSPLKTTLLNDKLVANTTYIANDFDSTKVASYLCVNGRRTITVTFRVEDICGNIGKTQGTLTIIDRQPPIILLPKDVNLAEKDEFTDLTKTGRATIAYNFCDKNLTPTYSDQITLTKCQRLIRRTWSATDGCGNTGTATQTLVQPLPTITAKITGDTTICVGGSTILDAGAGYTYLWSTNATTQTITARDVGTYSVVITDANQCIARASVKITIKTAVTPTITGNVPFCLGKSITLSVKETYAKYEWDTKETTQSITVNQSARYTVSVTDAQGCQGTATVSTSTYPNPRPKIESSTDGFCKGKELTLTAQPSIDEPAYSTYNWSNGSKNSSIIITDGGTYSVSVTDVNGCTGTAAKTIRIFPQPIFDATTVLVTCNPTNGNANIDGKIKLTNFSANDRYDFSAGTTYSGNKDFNTATTIGTDSLLTKTLANPTTTQIYTIRAFTKEGCFLDKTVTLARQDCKVPCNLTANATNSGAVCIGEKVTVAVTPANMKYLWSDGTTAQQFETTKAGAYSVTVTDTNNCTATASSTVIINPLPVVNISSNKEICIGTETTITASGGGTYKWSSGETNPEIKVKPTTNTTYTVTVTTSNVCTATASSTITINSLPNFEAVTQLVSCSPTGIANVDGKIKLTNFSVNDRFDFTEGITYSGSADYSTAQSIGTDSLLTKTLANPSVVQNYVIRVFSSKGCFVDKTVTLAKQDCKVPCNLTATATNSGAKCAGGTVIVAATPANLTYLWSEGSTTQQFAVTKAGLYTVTVTDANKCTATASTTVIMNPLPIATIYPNKDICTGAEATITASGGASYKWNTNETTASIKVKPILTTDYLVSVTDANGCVGTASTKINVVSAPSFVVNATIATCTGTTANSDAKLTLIGFKETERFDFMVGNVYTGTKTYATASLIPQNGTIASALPNPQTAQNYVVRVFNEANCFTDHTVMLNPKTDCKCVITVTVPSNHAACIGGNFALTASISGGTGVTFEWKNPDGVVVGTTAKLELTNVQATQNGTYTFTAKNSDGCTQSSTTNVTIHSSPNFTAKAIQATCTNATPNSDAKLEIAGFAVSSRFDFSLGNSYSGTKNYATAAAIPASGILMGTLANPQAAQIYTIRVINDKECFTDKTVTLLPKTDCLQPCQVKVSLAATNKGVVCTGSQETLKLTVTGAIGAIKYAWSGADNFRSALPEVEITNIQSRQAGTYSVTATDFNNCTATASITLTVNEAPNFQLIAIKPTFTATCASNGDGSLSIAELTNGDRYDLSESATYTGNATYNTAKPIPSDKILVKRIESPTVRQNYAIRIFNKNECFDTKSVAFDPQVCSPNCVMQVTLPPSISICAGEKLTTQATITNGTATQFIWKDAKGAIVSNKNTLDIPNIAREQRGIYSLRVTESGGCTKDAQIEVLVRDLPALELGANRRVCANETTLLEAPSAETYKWSTGDVIRVIGVKPQIPTVYSLTVTNQFGCKNMDSIKLTIATVLAVTNLTRACVNDNLLVNFEVKGEPKIEIVEGKGAMRGNIFTSNLLPNKSNYNFVIKDACATFPVTGTHDCAAACTTNAGSMTIQANDQTACVTGSVKAIFNNDFKSDGNDSLVFVLHDNPGNVLGEVLGVRKKPLFEFQANLLTDKTYYISPVAGNKDPKTGVNFSDACLSVGKGAPISFKKAPPIPRELRGTAAVCTGQDILIETEKYEATDAKYRWIIPAANNKEDTITTNLPKYTIKNAQSKNAGSYFVFVETGGCQSTMLGPLDVKVATVGASKVKVEKREQHICQAVTQIDLKASAAPSGFSGIWLSLSGATVQAPMQNITKALNLKRGRNDFVWRVSSKECVAGTDTATIIFEFKPQPKPDQFTLDYTELVMDVLKNDSIISPKDVRVTLTKLPAEGTAEMLPNNKIRYTVRSDYEGDVLFTYKVCNTKAMCPDSCATANIGIKVLNVPDLPNFITPNEDGVNDFFPPEEVIENDQLIKLKVLIVNRWGDLVYINENILETQDAWRGDYRGNGKTLPEGAYFYFVEQTYKTKGKQPNKSGAIHLLLKEK